MNIVDQEVPLAMSGIKYQLSITFRVQPKLQSKLKDKADLLKNPIPV